jgi:hypothetical protein
MIPNAGDFALVRVNGIVGWLIRVGQWLNGDGFADFEHAFVCVGPNSIVEAEPRGARIGLLSEYEGRPIVFYRAPPGTGVKIAEQALGLVGTPYSFLDYVALALWRFKFLDRRIEWVATLVRGYVQSTGHQICSQLVDEAYRRGGVHLFNDGRLSQDVTPGDLHQLIDAQDATNQGTSAQL